MLHTKTAQPILISTLKELMSAPFLKDFYLVGGTGLALLLGHRNSVDIDMFTHLPYVPDELSQELTDYFGERYQKTGSNKSMLFCYINDVKVDFVNNKIPLLFPVHSFDDTRIADVRDIAPLKMNAIFGRGSKKDFIDLYVLLNQFEVGELIELFKKQFPSVDIGQLLISMYYYGDAESGAQPKLYIDTTWEEIKKSISQKIIAYLKK